MTMTMTTTMTECIKNYISKFDVNKISIFKHELYKNTRFSVDENRNRLRIDTNTSTKFIKKEFEEEWMIDEDQYRIFLYKKCSYRRTFL